MKQNRKRQRELDAIAVLEAALAADFGVEVPCPNGTLNVIRFQLYEARRANSRYQVLAILQSPLDVEGALWVMKKEVEDGK